ncbi:IS21-like element helper ATPase IstB [Alkalihalobacillus sp. LMS39]|uniref:IS21-like element helper ATPase IstB n=1 Tax=Alkalihalobacillus sp. LMS39 TaxID=2924032 RepID=UPI001FB337C9|nr:IS21-like element helper ATPase IstB [Alkalihalobacillus sp. LMS39]UOE96295.1 IS21-like element helper ATPase IstB [Alkalihalobacillus sp. LMS39]UOE96326.1 IS21-like element helper ATPase IstB [Alkalihalobacillus sp. LMS39]UOE96334.1 IS21-like element helper ATPase IstB [Alkalihalobacillus sp. LMS39]UOE96408.1 IS21-like element helper ATPase IstB [Alkalihalobacillus sp. LMS39]UOE96557.1 IS21-like element helper ATPase IstB [Alkalihalobacillus sp. LMS39]
MQEKIQEYAKRLKLSWIRENFHKLDPKDPQDYLLTLFEKEIEQREERKINLLLKAATLPNASGKPFNWQDIQLGQGLSQQYLLDGEFIDTKENMVFYGGVGAGKTYLSTLIGINAIHKYGKRVKFYTIASLANELLDANEKGTLTKLFKRIEKLDLLILDELGYIPLHKQGAELLFQVISLCYEKRSIIITTNLQFGQWNHVFGDPILTEAVVDRLIHHSHLVLFGGDSNRMKESLALREL